MRALTKLGLPGPLPSIDGLARIHVWYRGDRAVSKWRAATALGRTLLGAPRLVQRRRPAQLRKAVVRLAQARARCGGHSSKATTCGAGGIRLGGVVKGSIGRQRATCPRDVIALVSDWSCQQTLHALLRATFVQAQDLSRGPSGRYNRSGSWRSWVRLREPRFQFDVPAGELNGLVRYPNVFSRYADIMTGRCAESRYRSPVGGHRAAACRAL